MKSETQDGLAIWGLALIALMAIAGAEDRFGPIGAGVVILLLLFPAYRVFDWLGDAQQLRREEEQRHL